MKRIHIILIIVIAVGIGVVVTSITSASTTVTFDKAFANAGKEYQIKGVLDKNKAIEYDPIKNPNLFAFYIFDKKNEERKVVFNGTKPENFEHTDTIVVTGKAVGAEFVASKILTKCPSKYTNKQGPQTAAEQGVEPTEKEFKAVN
ncbi:MAG: cytochrome c maturation protein CcmE [Sphingobacteriales bacterium JAD_PAG50586_3]|nr:MAG: cytochrome c maturation protein CcmE [Sphingobacteriales bacterium JAD_PAG50586_3]